MTKIKLTNGTVINAESVDLNNGVLRITTKELAVEELATLFSNKDNTSLITLMTENETETGYKTGFTSFAGISYDAEGNKTVELFQPKDVTEARLSNVEATTNTVANSVTDVELAMVEIYEMIAGGN
jgi:F0F1-type ATP synthase delta subunit